MVSQLSKPSWITSDYNPDFDYLRDVYKDCLKRYLDNKIYSNWKQAQMAIEKGRKVLESEDEVDTYIAFYGAQHYYKLEEAFDALNISRFDNQELEIFCYGCGVATEALSLVSYSQANKITLDIKTLALIEPSRIALNRGVEDIQKALQNEEYNKIKIEKIYKTLGDLEENDVASESETLKLHIFSNILDVKEIDLKALSSLIKNTQRGANYFICVNPENSESKRRIDSFYQELSNLFHLSNICTKDQAILGKEFYIMKNNQYSQRNIPRYHRIFCTDPI